MQAAKVLFGADGIVAATVAAPAGAAEHGPDIGGKLGDLFLPIGTIRALVKDLGISGTPEFIVGTELIPGALDVNGFKDMIAQAAK